MASATTQIGIASKGRQRFSGAGAENQFALLVLNFCRGCLSLGDHNLGDNDGQRNHSQGNAQLLQNLPFKNIHYYYYTLFMGMNPVRDNQEYEYTTIGRATVALRDPSLTGGTSAELIMF